MKRLVTKNTFRVPLIFSTDKNLKETELVKHYFVFVFTVRLVARQLVVRFKIFVILALLVIFYLPIKALTASENETLQITWVDLAFAHFYPIPNTRLSDFSDVNMGALARVNFQLFDITPLWLSTSFLYQKHTPNIARIETLSDYGLSVGAGWRFPFQAMPFHKGILDRFYFTPRFDYAILLHATFGDYYDDPGIYPADPRAGIVKNRYFWDSYQMVQLELAYDLTPTLKNISWLSGIQSEIFFSPSLIFFPEQDRNGYELGYLIGIRAKGGVSSSQAILAGRVIDDETGEVLKSSITYVEAGSSEDEKKLASETFAYNVDSTRGYALRGVSDGYESNTVSIKKDTLEKDKRKIVTIRLKKIREWGVYGNVYLKETKEPIQNIEVFALETKNGNNPSLTDKGLVKLTASTGKMGGFRMKLKPNTNYDILFKKVGLFTIRGQFSTKGKKPGWYPVNKYLKVMVQEALAGQKIDFENIYYDTGSWKIRKESRPVLNKMTQFLFDNSNIVVELSAHTDSRGSDRSNQVLSRKRAQSAVKYIVKKGISSKTISPKGYGEQKILNRCSNDVKCNNEEHQLNRRTEFRVRQILKKAI